MDNVKKAQLIVREAETSPENYSKYDKALRVLAKRELEAGNKEAARFILNDLSEALTMTVLAESL